MLQKAHNAQYNAHLISSALLPDVIDLGMNIEHRPSKS